MSDDDLKFIDPVQEKINRLLQYVNVDPQNPLLQIELGDQYHRAGRYHEALGCFEAAQRIDSRVTQAKTRIANVFLSQHRFAEAEVIYTAAIEIEPVADLYHNLGLALIYQQKWPAALTAFLAAEQKGCSYPKNLENLAYAFHFNKDTQQALVAAKRWYAQDPSPRAAGYISLIEMDDGQISEAISRAQMVLQKDPDNVDAHTVLGTFDIEKHDITSSQQHFLTVIHQQPQNPRAWQGLGLTYVYQQEFNEALKCLVKAQDLMPENATNCLIIGWMLITQKNFDSASVWLHKGLALERNFSEIHGALAVVLIYQGRLEEAKSEIKKAERLDNGGLGAVYAQSLLKQLEGQSRSATDLLDVLLERKIAHDDKRLMEHLEIYFRQQKYAGSAKILPSFTKKLH